ncbi:hypothetical protein A3J90_08390 [candidate division WOR-1 bacterium RIFOXYC2_FULL_37_10]|uniref:Uncharacterized protein n=1 Tax=candidate division WOR-1 bacterium RIFOXYB2_FULL_37_13 TaxID=1802579 RepID=A0A1F4SV20_UNCSA|nr:MAG: hypothetical protein A2310_08170 [candidate division WOR-1 bacterium RIFOXYB2_FULL_37_13]OGC36383.1 MAG: hypothetical protein A3J90_08390 [candidate division WOR-1 bacterium RIFOXYC2_FULL_37_10]
MFLNKKRTLQIKELEEKINWLATQVLAKCDYCGKLKDKTTIKQASSYAKERDIHSFSLGKIHSSSLVSNAKYICKDCLNVVKDQLKKYQEILKFIKKEKALGGKK